MKNLEQYKKNLHILYIEDDLAILNEMKRILESFFIVSIATNGQEAMSIFKKNKIDIIISDINMPVMDGIEFLHILREENEHTPFIFVTAKSDLNRILEAIKLDIDGYILKPLDIRNLFEIINKIIDKKYKNYLFEDKENRIKINDLLYWDKKTKTLLQNQEKVKLTKKEIMLIDLLLENNKTFDINEIIYHLWEDDLKIKDYASSLKNIISRLRNKVPSLEINNIYGVGYQINSFS